MQVCFCGNLKSETRYREYLQKLIKSTLNVTGYYQERKKINTYYIIINSEGIFDLFHSKFDFPIGFKSFFNIENFPRSWNLQKRLIRGIFDTDGSIFFDKDQRYKKPYPILDITLKNKEVLDWIAKILRGHNFKVIRYGRHVRLKGRENIGNWFKEISPKNDLHVRKYSRWLMEYYDKGP
ncbi:hypothetical protein JXA56_01775 [Candidatus Micrarchaeota archaeon]|nr:hypothetical protein [Candidatus Micrarchaeota archaeon]